MRNHPKRVRQALRKLVDTAYERELHCELAALDASFAEWRSGQIDDRELHKRIHRYHNGTARELWKKYQYGDAVISVAVAVRDGVLRRDEVPPEVLEVIRHWPDDPEQPSTAQV